MKEIFKILKNQNDAPFLRLIAFDDHIDLFHIANNNLINKLSEDLQHIGKIFSYILLNKNLLLEFVISAGISSCNSISKKDISNRELYQITSNKLFGENVKDNAIFLDKPPYGNFLSICSAVLSHEILDFIKRIMSFSQNINFIPWPVWVVSTYFENFPLDEDKFKCSLFFVEKADSCDILAYVDSRIVCYRSSNIKISEKNKELEDTISYIKKAHKMSLEEIAVYNIDNQILKLFYKRSKVKMEMICNELNNNILKYNQINKTARITFSIASLFIVSQIFFAIFNIISVNNQKSDQESVINSLERDLLLELNLWSEIDYSQINVVDFRSLLKKHLENKEYKKIQNVSVAFDENSNEATINSIKADD